MPRNHWQSPGCVVRICEAMPSEIGNGGLHHGIHLFLRNPADEERGIPRKFLLALASAALAG